MGSSAQSIDVIRDPDRVAAVLQPLRLRMLGLLSASADSASGLARQLDVPRQKVNYHLRELEREGFVEFVEERRRGNCVERILRATAASYLISPEVLGQLGETPIEAADRFSSTYLLAAATALLREVAVLRHRADQAGKPLATLTLQADVRFGSAADRNAMAEELARAFATITARYHDQHARDGRIYRFLVGAHPAITKTAEEAAAEARPAPDPPARNKGR